MGAFDLDAGSTAVTMLRKFVDLGMYHRCTFLNICSTSVK